jgi:hypothetical protein
MRKLVWVRCALLVLAVVTVYLGMTIADYQGMYSTDYCSSEWEWVQMGYACDDLFHEYVQEPLRAAQWLLSGFFLLLAILPGSLLRGWFQFVSWWILPIILVMAYQAFTFPPYGGDGFSPVQVTVGDEGQYILFLLYGVTVIYSVVYFAYRKIAAHRTST